MNLVYIKQQYPVRFEDVTMVVINCYMLWDITQCNLLKVNIRFGGIFPFHLQGQKVSQERNQNEVRSK